MSFLSIPPKRAGPEALLTGDSLIREPGQGGDVMIMHLPSIVLSVTSAPAF